MVQVEWPGFVSIASSLFSTVGGADACLSVIVDQPPSGQRWPWGGEEACESGKHTCIFSTRINCPKPLNLSKNVKVDS